MMNYKLVTLGCKVNFYESGAIGALLENAGFHHGLSEENIDVVIINTCSVTSTSDQKSRQQIRKEIKNHPEAIIVVMGCYSQIALASIEEIPGVAIIIGASNRHLIPELIKKYQEDKKQITLVDKDSRNFSYEELGLTSATENVRVYLKIQDGCDNFCSYCIIPLTRGKMRSRAMNDIINEAKIIIQKGYPEIILTGIHTGGYGQDFQDGTSLFTLIKQMLIEVPDIKRLRISSIEESEISKELIELIRDDKRIARHLHIPLQSGSSSVLKRMHRKYDVTSFIDKIAEIRQAIPDIAITTDVIVGFPGESEEEFNETRDFIKTIGFARLHVFPFSARTRTLASRMPNQILPQIKKERVRNLLALNEELVNQYINKFINQPLSVIFEDYDPAENVYRGHSSNYIYVKTQSKTSLIGKMVDIIYK